MSAAESENGGTGAQEEITPEAQVQITPGASLVSEYPAQHQRRGWVIVALIIMVITVLCCALAASIILFAKGRDGAAAPSDATDAAFGAVRGLGSPTWVLKEPIEGPEITDIFADGQVSGSAGCNSYAGVYDGNQAAHNSTLSISGLVTTQMM